VAVCCLCGGSGLSAQERPPAAPDALPQPCFYFLGVCVDGAVPETGVWQKRDSVYVNDRNATAKNVLPVTPYTADSILNRYENMDRYAFRGRYGEYAEQYLQMMIRLPDGALEKYDDISYLLDYWMYYSSKWKGDPNRTSELMALSALELEKYVPEKDRATVERHRLWMLYDSYLAVKKEARACAYWAELHEKDHVRYRTPQEFLYGLARLLIFEQDMSCESCAAGLTSQFIRQYDRGEWRGNAAGQPLEVEIMLADAIRHLTNREELKTVALDLKNELLKALETGALTFDPNRPEWYRLLNEVYLDGRLKPVKTIALLKQDLQDFAEAGGIRTDDDRYVARMEYLFYYSLYQFITGEKNPQHLTPVLQETERLGFNPSFRATYSRIEKELAAILLKKTGAGHAADTKPPKITLLSPPARSTEATVQLSGIVTDENDIRFLNIGEQETSVETDGSFNAILPLEKGKNSIRIVCEDVHGNRTEKKQEIEYTPVSDPLLTRKDYAFIITFDRFRAGSNWKPLNNTKKDGEDIGRHLSETYGFEVEYRRNLDKKEFNRFLYTRIGEGEFSAYDQVLIYISGHGDRDGNCLGYLVMSDSEDSRTDFTHDTYVSYADLTSRLRSYDRCRHILLIVDACHSGAIEESLAFEAKGAVETSSKSEELVRTGLRAPTRFFLTSGGLEQVSDGQPGYNSPFVIEFLKALQMENARSGLLTLTDIHPYFGKEKRSRFDPAGIQCDEHKVTGPQWGAFGQNVTGTNFIFTVRNSPKTE
jgi:hypothetical protein